MSVTKVTFNYIKKRHSQVWGSHLSAISTKLTIFTVVLSRGQPELQSQLLSEEEEVGVGEGEGEEVTMIMVTMKLCSCDRPPALPISTYRPVDNTHLQSQAGEERAEEAAGSERLRVSLLTVESPVRDRDKQRVITDACGLARTVVFEQSGAGGGSTLQLGFLAKRRLPKQSG